MRINKYCRNPYTLKLVVGEKGQGKSLYLARLASKYKGFVYSNFGVGIPLSSDYYNHTYPSNSLILIDEGGLVHSNRDFKSFPFQAIEWYKYQRKNKLNVIITSQTMDIDKKIRDLVDRLVLVRRMPGVFGFVTYGIAYKHAFEVVQTEMGARLADVERRCGFAFVHTIPKSLSLAEYDTEKKVNVTKPN